MSLPSLRIAGSSLPLLGLLGVLGLIICARSATAQQRATPFEIRKIISTSGQLSAADRATLDRFLKTEIFKHFLDKDSVAKLPAVRKDFGNVVRGVDRTPAHDAFNEMTLKLADYVVSPKDKRFGPPAKVNALLLVGDLNENDAANRVKPLPAALPLLVETMMLPLDDERAYLKPVALLGITRFAEEKAIPPAQIPAVTEALLTMLNETDPPAGRSAGAHNFIRRGAARALATLGTLGPNNGVVQAFAEIAADSNARIGFRCEMTQFIGELNIPPDAKVDLKGLANTIGHQTVEICEQELERASAENKPPSRRILMYALYSGGMGLTGLTRSAEKDPEALKFISGIRNKTTALYKTLDNIEGTPDDQIDEKVAPEIEGLRGMLLAKPAAPAPVVAAAPQGPVAQPQRPTN